MNNLYSCRLVEDDSHVLIVAETAQKAKVLFWHNRIVENWDDRYIDVRVKFLQRNVSYPPGVYATNKEEWMHYWYCSWAALADSTCDCWWCRKAGRVEK